MLFVTTLKQLKEHVYDRANGTMSSIVFPIIQARVGNTYEDIEVFYVASSMIDDIYLINVNACPYFQLVIKLNIKPLHGVCYNNQASTNE